MFSWIDERPDIVGSIIQGYVWEFQREESRKAEAAIRQIMSPHDLRIVEWYLDGKLIIMNEELQSLFRYHYEVVYVGPKFSHVTRTLKEKTNG